MRWVALLRGINVGGKSIVKMADLRTAFEDFGYTNVETYIQSGNVVFDSSARSAKNVAAKLERELEALVKRELVVVALSADMLAKVVKQAPRGFGSEPKKYHYDVVFVRTTRSAKEILGDVATKPGVDTVSAGDHALYFRRLTSKASSSRFSRVSQQDFYADITIRNWRTTKKLLEMVSA
jgi:uncharacterized protein (DUF1697 family)